MEKKNIILIVDDNSYERLATSKFLSSRGYQPEVASSAQEAMRIIRCKKIDLILLDVIMHEMSGLEFCSLLKTNGKTKDIPVIFLSACINNSTMVKGIELGAHAYFIKPFDKDELAQKIRDVIKFQKQMN